MLALALLAAAFALSPAHKQFAHFVDQQQVVPHPEAAWRFAAEVYREVGALVEARPYVIEPVKVGESVEGRPLWAFKVADPGHEVRSRVLVFANIHAMEWIGTEACVELLKLLVASPPQGVEVVVLPILNPDGRHKVEEDLLTDREAYRRGNAELVDLNRDYEVNRTSTAIWRHFIPGRYATSPAPLSQPESRAVDELGATGFDVAISLHAFGGYIYFPWAGLFERAPDWHELHELGVVMQSGQEGYAYKPRQLSHWAFFFRGMGMELDHLYGKYGTYAYLIECTRSGWDWRHPGDFFVPFRMYNPRDPSKHQQMVVGALRAMIGHLSLYGPPPAPAHRTWDGSGTSG